MGTNSSVSSSSENQRKKRIQEKAPTILRIPRCTFHLILENLSVYHLAISQRVCKQFETEINSSGLWRRRGRELFPELEGMYETDEEWKTILYEYLSKKKKFSLNQFRFHVSVCSRGVLRHAGLALVESFRPEVNPKYRMTFELDMPEAEWNLVHANYDLYDEDHNVLITIEFHKNIGKMVRKFRMKKNSSNSFTTTMGERKVLIQVHHKAFQFLMKPKNHPSQFKIANHDTVVTNLLKVFGMDHLR
jgi:hypothetical protein